MAVWKKYRITYFYKPDYDDVVIIISARSYEEAVQFGKDFREHTFSVEELHNGEWRRPW